MRPWKLSECHYGHVREQSFEVAVLPLGATEPHNLHLPYGTDILEADIVGEQICQAAHDAAPRWSCCPRSRMAPRRTCASCRWR